MARLDIAEKRIPQDGRISIRLAGRAIDIRLPGCDTRKLREACLDLKTGGVGYYPRSDFVHLDTGAFRTWQG